MSETHPTLPAQQAESQNSNIRPSVTLAAHKVSVNELFDQIQSYETILNRINDSVCVTDRDDIITFINNACSITTGLSADRLTGTNILLDILTGSPEHFHRDYAQARSRLTPIHFESIPATTITGIPLTLSGWCIPKLADGIFDGMISTFTNITEQQLTREKLSESEIRFRSIAETATDGIITVNGSGQVVFWNSAASEIFGYPDSEVMGANIYQIMPEDVIADHGHIFEEPEASTSHPSVGRTVNGKARRKDGSIFPIELSLASWTMGTDVYFSAIIRDITLRKRIEESLHNSELELKALSSRLLNAHEQERKRISYELHDGLGQILSAAKIGAKSLINAGTPLSGSPASPDSLMANIQSAIDEVRRISRDLRPSILDDLGIITAINAFCDDFQRTHSVITVIKNITARDEDIPENIKIVIYRVTQEACTNIVRHSHADMMAVDLSSVSGKVCLSIHDNGTGFDPHTVHRCRVSERGLGLSSMKERIEFSGGNFTLISSPDQGTTVQALWHTVQPEA